MQIYRIPKLLPIIGGSNLTMYSYFLMGSPPQRNRRKLSKHLANMSHRLASCSCALMEYRQRIQKPSLEEPAQNSLNT